MYTEGAGEGEIAMSKIPVQIHLMTLSTGHGAHDSIQGRSLSLSQFRTPQNLNK